MSPESDGASPWNPRRRLVAAIRRSLPPARLVWLVLAVIGGYGAVYFGGLGISSLLLLGAVASLVDLGFQRVRFPQGVRFPDSAIATGLFIALLLPPTVSLLQAGVVTLAAVGLKHTLRSKGRPVLNPAASGVLLGVLLFGMAPAWWIAVGPYGEDLMVLLGAVILLRNLSRWRLQATFLAVYGPFWVFSRVLLGAALAPRILLLGALDPVILFFGLYMVIEPRTAPRDPLAQPLYAALIAFGAALLPSLLPSAGILVTLLAVNLGTNTLVAFRSRLSHLRPVASTQRGEPRTGPRKGSVGAQRKAPSSRWTVGRRLAAGVLLFVIVGAFAAGTHAPTPTPSVAIGGPPHAGGGGSGASALAKCQTDNSAVPPATLSSLHKALGPSVILSYDANTGTTVFYDPVNSVTVTETDLYEDYGYAEFNGDDYAVSGCAPS